MKQILFISLIAFVLACSKGGSGGGGADSWGRGKSTPNALTEEQKQEFLDVVDSMNLARRAHERISYPSGDCDTTQDWCKKELEMYNRLKGKCTPDIKNQKEGDKTTYHETISGNDCAVSFTYHSESTDAKTLENEEYKVLNPDYQSLNDVYGRQYQQETRMNQSNSASQGQGTLFSNKYKQLEFYTFSQVESDVNGNTTKVTSGVGVNMPFGLAQATMRMVGAEGKTTVQWEINGEVISNEETVENNPTNTPASHQ